MKSWQKNDSVTPNLLTSLCINSYTSFSDFSESNYFIILWNKSILLHSNIIISFPLKGNILHDGCSLNLFSQYRKCYYKYKKFLVNVSILPLSLMYLGYRTSSGITGSKFIYTLGKNPNCFLEWLDQFSSSNICLFFLFWRTDVLSLSYPLTSVTLLTVITGVCHHARLKGQFLREKVQIQKFNDKLVNKLGYSD